MATLELKVKVNTLNIDKVKLLVDTLASHMDELPKELQDKLIEIAETESVEYTVTDMIEEGIDISQVKVVADGKELKRVIGLNKILRRVKVHDVDIGVHYVFPESITVTHNGTELTGW